MVFKTLYTYALLRLKYRILSYLEVTKSRALVANLRGASTCAQSPCQDSGFQRVSLRQNLNLEGWNSHVHREFPGNLELTNLSRDNLGREIGGSRRTQTLTVRSQPTGCDLRQNRNNILHTRNGHLRNHRELSLAFSNGISLL